VVTERKLQKKSPEKASPTDRSYRPNTRALYSWVLCAPKTKFNKKIEKIRSFKKNSKETREKKFLCRGTLFLLIFFETISDLFFENPFEESPSSSKRDSCVDSECCIFLKNRVDVPFRLSCAIAKVGCGFGQPVRVSVRGQRPNLESPAGVTAEFLGKLCGRQKGFGIRFVKIRF